MQIAVRLLNAILMIALPLAVAPIFARRLGAAWRLFALGALTFVASQLLHIPFNALALAPLLESVQESAAQPFLAFAVAAVLAGLSAGIFEELSRYLVLRFWLRQDRRWRDMLMFGLGHGGIEAMLLGMVALYAFFQALALRQADLAALVPAEQVQAASASLASYWQVPWHMALLGALERALSICLHLGLSALVWKAVVRKAPGWVAVAIAWHAAANAAALIVYKAWGPWAAEGTVAIAAALSLLMLFASRRDEPAAEAVPSQAAPASRPPIEKISPAKDANPSMIDDSRYLD